MRARGCKRRPGGRQKPNAGLLFSGFAGRTWGQFLRPKTDLVSEPVFCRSYYIFLRNLKNRAQKLYQIRCHFSHPETAHPTEASEAEPPAKPGPQRERDCCRPPKPARRRASKMKSFLLAKMVSVFGPASCPEREGNKGWEPAFGANLAPEFGPKG